MQSAEELIRLSQLVRVTATALLKHLREEASGSETLQVDADDYETAKRELGMAFQALVRAAHALGIEQKPRA